MLKKIKLFTVLSLLLTLSVTRELCAYSYKPDLPVTIYSDGDTWDKSTFFLPTNWTADVPCARFDDKCTDTPKKGKYCLKFDYDTGIYHIFNWIMLAWVFPAYNWANVDGGLDLSDATKISFWARGKTGGEYIVIGFGGNYGVYSDTVELVFGPVQLSSKWEKYTFPIKGEDKTHISQGFSLIIRLADNPAKSLKKSVITIYLDDAKIE